MTSDAGKRLDRLEKLLDTIATRNKQHHFVVLQPGDDETLEIEALANVGIINEGDDVQVINIPWKIHTLTGTQYIPEGNSTDPLADPRTKAGSNESSGDGSRNSGDGGVLAASPTLDPPPSERIEAWRKHVRDIELAGDRYQGPKLAGR